MSQRREPNHRLAQLVEDSGASSAALAHRVNELAASRGVNRAYTHTSIKNWTARGMVPDTPAPALLATALGERLGRTVSLEEMGMADTPTSTLETGLNFPRDPDQALHLAAEYWSTVDRRSFVKASPFAITAYTSPVTRWLSVPADPPLARSAGRRVGRADLDELWNAAEDARRWDSKFGGGNWRASMVTDCLNQRAVPLLRGTFTDRVGSELFAATAELARVAAWHDVDMGNHAGAQSHFVQALRLARASGDPAVGSYVLATMALHTFLRGFPDEAVDMAEGAYERAGHDAPARVLAFAKLAEARAHGRAGNEPAAAAALIRCQRLVDAADTDPRDPDWLAYLTRARVAADAAEVYRDLNRPAEALRWDRQAAAMPAGVFSRAVGIRQTVIATAHLQQKNLEPGLECGERALTILRTVRSTRSRTYLRTLTTALDPWRRTPDVADFLHRADRALTTG
ncbi:sporulation protein (plasmid) [Kitasatospora purpeofusca]|uniref:sporulation protein n=1 Tax=Kitasatospora purpeofusca TaxID=67352 RepID=UPI002E141E9E|nr:sporulation protein [Kitasatospora purpeofusca]